MTYVRSWTGPLLDALGAARDKDVQRGVSTVGPHRDELELTLAGLPSRTHASQGEQRSLALALQLAAHELATDRLGTAPVLLLDDVFSELDPLRSRALLEGLPPGQAMLTTAQPAPPEVTAAKVYDMAGGGHVVASGGTPVSPEPPHRRNSEPRPLDGSLEALSKRLGMEGAVGVGRLFAGWTEIVGEAMAEHVQPRPDRPIGPGGDRRSPGLGHPGPPPRGHPPRPGLGLRRGRATRPPGRPGSALREGRADHDHRPGAIHRAATLGHWNRGRSEGPDVRSARPGARRDTASQPLEHCERARLWR